MPGGQVAGHVPVTQSLPPWEGKLPQLVCRDVLALGCLSFTVLASSWVLKRPFRVCNTEQWLCVLVAVWWSVASLGVGQGAPQRAEHRFHSLQGRGSWERGAHEVLWSGSREPQVGWPAMWGPPIGGLTHHLTPPQEKRLSTESGLSADSHLSASTASQGEPEGLLAEEEEPSQQESTPTSQEEVTEETYEEVRLAVKAACPGVGPPPPAPPPSQAGCCQDRSRCRRAPQVCSFLCGAQQEPCCPRQGRGPGDEGLHPMARFGMGPALPHPSPPHIPLLGCSQPPRDLYRGPDGHPSTRLLRVQRTGWAELPGPPIPTLL